MPNWLNIKFGRALWNLVFPYRALNWKANPLCRHGVAKFVDIRPKEATKRRVIVNWLCGSKDDASVNEVNSEPGVCVLVVITRLELNLYGCDCGNLA
jgi:hypothetical protein